MAADQNTVAAQGLWLLADEFEKEGCIPQAIKCLEAICQAGTTFLPLVEVRTRVWVGGLLLDHTDNIQNAKSHLERAQILLKQIPRGHLDLKATACNLLSRCYHLVGNTTLQKSILAKGLDLAEKQLAVDKEVATEWMCRFYMQRASAFVTEGGERACANALEMLSKGRALAEANNLVGFKVLFGVSALHVHLQQGEEQALIAAALADCAALWAQMSPDQKRAHPGLVVYSEILHAMWRLRTSEFDLALKHVENLDRELAHIPSSSPPPPAAAATAAAAAAAAAPQLRASALRSSEVGGVKMEASSPPQPSGVSASQALLPPGAAPPAASQLANGTIEHDGLRIKELQELRDLQRSLKGMQQQHRENEQQLQRQHRARAQQLQQALASAGLQLEQERSGLAQQLLQAEQQRTAVVEQLRNVGHRIQQCTRTPPERRTQQQRHQYQACLEEKQQLLGAFAGLEALALQTLQQQRAAQQAAGVHEARCQQQPHALQQELEQQLQALSQQHLRRQHALQRRIQELTAVTSAAVNSAGAAAQGKQAEAAAAAAAARGAIAAAGAVPSSSLGPRSSQTSDCGQSAVLRSDGQGAVCEPEQLSMLEDEMRSRSANGGPHGSTLRGQQGQVLGQAQEHQQRRQQQQQQQQGGPQAEPGPRNKRKPHSHEEEKDKVGVSSPGPPGSYARLPLGPPPLDGEWMSRAAVSVVVDLLAVQSQMSCPKGGFKDCTKRINSGLQRCTEELTKLGVTHSSSERDLPHWAIWVAGLYLQLWLFILDSKASMDLTRVQLTAAQEALVSMLDVMGRFPYLLQESRGSVHLLLGNYAHSMGCFPEAIAHFHLAAGVAATRGDRGMEAMAVVCAALSHICIGRPENLSQALDLVMAVHEKKDSFVGTREKAALQFVYGLLDFTQGKRQDAKTRLAAGLKLTYERTRSHQLVSQYLVMVGRAARLDKDLVQTKKILTSALTLSRTMQDLPAQLAVLQEMNAVLVETEETAALIENEAVVESKRADLETEKARAHGSPLHTRLLLHELS